MENDVNILEKILTWFPGIILFFALILAFMQVIVMIATVIPVKMINEPATPTAIPIRTHCTQY